MPRKRSSHDANVAVGGHRDEQLGHRSIEAMSLWDCGDGVGHPGGPRSRPQNDVFLAARPLRTKGEFIRETDLWTNSTVIASPGAYRKGMIVPGNGKKVEGGLRGVLCNVSYWQAW